MSLLTTPYNLTVLQNGQTISDLVSYANVSTGGVLSGLFLAAVFFILMISLRKASFIDSFVASSFICFVLSIFMLIAGFISFYVVLALLLLTAFSLFYLGVTKHN